MSFTVTDKWIGNKVKTGYRTDAPDSGAYAGNWTSLLGDSIYNTSTMNREQCTIYRAAYMPGSKTSTAFNGRKIELEVPVPEDFKKYGGFYVSSGS